MNSKRIDGFIIMLLAFMVLLGLLFVYLLKIESDVKHYNSYRDSIEKLKILDKEFDNFMLQKLSFINYDIITAQMDNFDTVLGALEAGGLGEEFGSGIEEKLEQVRLQYSEKRDPIEHFKSSNATIVNSIHYIFDLRKTLLLDGRVDQEIQKLLDKILFHFLQAFIYIYEDYDRLSGELEQLATHAQKLENKNLDYFYTQSRIILADIKELEQASSAVKTIHLFRTLETFQVALDRAYETKLLKEKLIALLFFLFSFVMLLTLFRMYKRSLKTKQELSAFKFAVEHSDNSIVMTDRDRQIVYVNDVFEKDTGYRKEEVLGKNPKILKSNLTPQKYYDQMNEVLDRGEKWEGEFINQRKDGSIFYEKASIVPVIINDTLVNYLAIKLDITDYILQEEKLKLSATAFENTQESIMITDENETILSVNKAFEAMTGYTEEEALGKTPKILRSNRHDETFYNTLWNSVMENGSWKGKIFDRTKAGDVIPTWLSITAIKNDEGKVTNYIAIHTNLEEIVKSQERADYLAYHDSLTDLPNRINFEEHLQYLLKVSKRNKSTLAVLFIDLDRFKVINDTLGHHVGDGMLQTIAERVKKTLRDADMLARIGWDEFVIVLDTIDHESDAAHVCEKVLAAIAQPIEVDNYTLNTTASIGVALYPDDGDDVNTIIKHADSAMYHAKDKGKNNYQFYTEKLSVDVHNRLEMEQTLRHAIDEDELFLLFQPQYELATKRVIGAEALLRWESKILGNISPADFIPVAEDTGDIIAIGQFVFESACKALVDFREAGLDIETIAINVSSVQFRQKDLLQNFKAIIDKYGISPQCIELEITERYIMEFTTGNMTVLEKFRKFGFKISIDDFGTGYSSMSYLKKLPLDTIKVDKSFVDDIPHDINDVEITKAIIALSKSLGYSVIAEGIENREQEDFLLEHGCDIGQGYLFGRPVSGDELIAFIKERDANEDA